MGYRERQEKLKAERAAADSASKARREKNYKEAEDKQYKTYLAKNLVDKQGNSPREKFLKDSVATEYKKATDATSRAGIEKAFPEESNSTKNRLHKLSKMSGDLNSKLSKDVRNYRLLMEQPGKSKREEFLRDSVSREYNKTASDYLRTGTEAAIIGNKAKARSMERDLKVMRARGDTANQRNDYTQPHMEINEVPLRKKKKK